MSPNHVCPSCGAALEENVGSSCPFCGSALSMPTIISTPAKKKKAASSAEAMDEVKKLVSEGDTAGAAEVASAEFGLNQEAAQSTVEQVATEMKYSGAETIMAGPIPPKASEPVVENIPVAEPAKPSNKRSWIIGGSIAAVVFLCLCCCLPLVIAAATMLRNR